MSNDGRLVGVSFPGLPAEFRRRVGYEILLPNASFCRHPGCVVRYLVRPVAVGRTMIRCDWLFSEEALSSPRFDAFRAVESWDITNRHDWRANGATPACLKGRLVRTTGLLLAFAFQKIDRASTSRLKAPDHCAKVSLRSRRDDTTLPRRYEVDSLYDLSSVAWDRN